MYSRVNMKYYKLYVSHSGRRKDAVEIDNDTSKNRLDHIMWEWKIGYYKHSRLFINEVNEKEVNST